MSKNLRWERFHKGHYEQLKEFYALNKYLITEQFKDALLDAIECMEYTMTEEGERGKETEKHGHWRAGTVCSECNTDVQYEYGIVYPPCCPNCGAKMDLKDGEQNG